MSYQIYESHCGEMIKFTYPKDLIFYGGKEYYANVQYFVTDSHYKEYWIAVCNNGQIIKVEPKKASHLLREKKIYRVGAVTKFHYQLSSLVSQTLMTGKQYEKEVKEVLTNRNRCLWYKEYRGA